MGYYVRLLVTSGKILPFSEIEVQGKTVKLLAGSDISWDQIEIYEPHDNLICKLERSLVYPGSLAEAELSKLKELIQGAYPVSAREWLGQYFSKVKAVYIFQLFADNITKEGWKVLGRIQNLLKDLLIGIIQADNEGFYNEHGDYILWQMYDGASGMLPAATLNDKHEWVHFHLKLTDAKAVDQFKQGIVPQKGFFGRLFRG